MACPFKGLASFDVDDAGVFFGRERLVAEMVARLAGAPLLGRRRAVGQRQVLGAARGAAGGAGGRRAAGQRALGAARCCAPASTRCERWSGERRRRAGGRLRRRGRPVRGDLHGLPRRGRARRVRRRARRARRDARRQTLVLLAVRADFYGRCAALSGAVAAARRQPRARRPDAPRRAAPRDRAARAARRAARRAGPRRRAGRATSRASPARCRCCRPRCSSSGSGATAAACGCAAYERAGGVRGAVARLAERAYERPRRRRSRPVARRILLRLAGEGEGDAVVRRRVRARRARGRRATSRRCSTCSPTSRLVTVGDGDGRGRPRGAAARVAAAARLARGGRRGAPPAPPPGRRGARLGRAAGATRASSTAARGWPPRSTGPRATAPSSTRPSARSSRRAGRERGEARAARAQPAPARAAGRRRGAARARAWSPAWSRSTSAAARATRRAPPTRSGSARRRSSTTDLDRSLLLARQGVALDDSPADPRQPARRADAQPGRDRRHAARAGERMSQRRAEPGRPHAGGRRSRGQRAPLRHATRRRAMAPDVQPANGPSRRSPGARTGDGWRPCSTRSATPELPGADEIVTVLDAAGTYLVRRLRPRLPAVGHRPQVRRAAAPTSPRGHGGDAELVARSTSRTGRRQSARRPVRPSAAGVAAAAAMSTPVAAHEPRTRSS